jgi:Dolichyl-phosphate-mannose-protein mannosyltransferase
MSRPDFGNDPNRTSPRGSHRTPGDQLDNTKAMPRGSLQFLFVVLAISFGMRAFHLMAMFPILVDESIYLRWAEIIHHQHEWFISLLDAKQPLSYWLYAGFRMIGGRDPLVAARLSSVFAGLLSTLGIYCIANKICGRTAANISALLYSVLPYAVFYDRLAYTEALVNCFGVWIVYTSLDLFDSEALRVEKSIAVGLCLGLGFFCKTTIAEFAFFPILACAVLNPARWRSLLPVYGITALFPIISFISLPKAPVFESNHWLFHQSQYLISLSNLLSHPTISLGRNSSILYDYGRSYITLPGLIAIGICLFFTLNQSEYWLLLSVTLVPLSFQTVVLAYFPSRYAFPHIWPLLVIVGCAVEIISRKPRRNWVIAAVAVLTLSIPVKAFEMLHDPAGELSQRDSQQFLGSHPYVGYGVNSAVSFLWRQSERGPLTVLTDPFWGPPADAIFAYLNLRNGIDVHEAWWLELSDDYPLMPKGEIALMKSHYERTYGGTIDFSTRGRVFYVTDERYFSMAQVKSREPAAQLVAKFSKPDGVDAIAVYSLK